MIARIVAIGPAPIHLSVAFCAQAEPRSELPGFAEKNREKPAQVLPKFSGRAS
jgi:hypothetical protein